MEIKKQINTLSKEGRILPSRIKRITNKKDQLKANLKEKDEVPNEELSHYVVENHNIATLLCFMQFFSAIMAEVLNMVLLTGERDIVDTIADFLLMYTISEIDNVFFTERHEPTLKSITEAGEDWQPVIVYPRVTWQDRTTGNQIQQVLL